jgi:hypothetical protein
MTEVSMTALVTDLDSMRNKDNNFSQETVLADMETASLTNTFGVPETEASTAVLSRLKWKRHCLNSCFDGKTLSGM